MVKISLKKESRVKKQNQKQKQSQKVVVNIGTNVLKPKRRRKASGPIEKKGTNKQQPTTVYIPQSLPVLQSSQPPNSISEFVKYLKESEKQKEVAQEKEKNKSNDLEKEKKEEKRSEVLTREEVQDNFSVVYPSSNISSLTGGRLTPEMNRFSNLSSLTTSGTTTPSLSRPVDHNLLFEALSREADLRSENPNSGKLSFDTFNSNISTDSFSSPLSTTPPTTSLINEPKNQTLDPVIDQVLEELPENQIVVYGPQRAGQTGTATAQLINPIDNSIPPPPPLRINKPLPTIRMSDIIAANTKPLSLTQISQKEIEREARLKAVEPKKPLLLESQSSQADAEDTIKILENLLKSDKKKEEDDDESKNKSDQEDSPELIALKSKLTDKNFSRKDMVNLLSKNGITKKDGLKYYIGEKYVNLGSKSTTKTALTEHILEEFNAGRITKL